MFNLVLPLILAVTLTWTDTNTTESGYHIERKTGTTGTYAQIFKTAANVTTYTDATAVAGTLYCYRLKAFSTSSQSAYSADACLLAAPGGVTISWT